MPLIRLIYASDALTPPTYDELMAILRRAVDHNEERGISGLLCYSSGSFLQVLEGERSMVNHLYHAILHDRRHHHCEILLCEEIVARRFEDWSMKLIGWDDAPTAQRRALVLRHSGTKRFEPKQMSGAQALEFLAALAEMERQTAA
jgi:hypothetical protein